MKKTLTTIFVLLTFICRGQITMTTNPIKTGGYIILAKSDKKGNLMPDTSIFGDTLLIVKDLLKQNTMLFDKIEEYNSLIVLPYYKGVKFKSISDKKKYYRILKKLGFTIK